jgi:RNA polymerase sigma factor (sigma-70 family)
LKLKDGFSLDINSQRITKRVEMEDKELVQATSQGDLTAFNELVLKYQKQVFNLARLILDNQDLAEDITQDTFILAFQKIRQFRGGSFRAWLLKIATNLCYDEIRTWKRNTFQALEPIDKEGEVKESPQWIKDPQPLHQEEAEANDLREILENTLNELPYKYRIPLSLIDIQELDYREAASVMGVPVGIVKSRLARGRMQFRKIWKEMDRIDHSKHKFVTEPALALLPDQSKYRNGPI